MATVRGEAVPYLALEWLDGKTLAEHVAAHGPMAERELLALLDPVLEALGKAHGGAVGQVIAHRDIKPENLFVTRGPGGEAVLRVLDFGIAKVMEEGEDATRGVTGHASTFAAFSPPFGAPEQFNPARHARQGHVRRRPGRLGLGPLPRLTQAPRSTCTRSIRPRSRGRCPRSRLRR